LAEPHGALERLEVGLHREREAEGLGEESLGGALAEVGAEADAARLLEVAALFYPVSSRGFRGRVFFLSVVSEKIIFAFALALASSPFSGSSLITAAGSISTQRARAHTQTKKKRAKKKKLKRT
jgi:hypothetical protein